MGSSGTSDSFNQMTGSRRLAADRGVSELRQRPPWLVGDRFREKPTFLEGGSRSGKRTKPTLGRLAELSNVLSWIYSMKFKLSED